MSKYFGPRLRIIRRLGKLVAFSQKELKRTTRPGQHGTNQRKITQFAYRLAEKQKLRFYYGISEKQLICYIKAARKIKGPTGEILLQKLEIRLDNIVYRLGWRPTLPFARQLVNHGHILVNKKCVTIASFSCVPYQIITIQNLANIRKLVKENFDKSSQNLPSYLSFNNENIIAMVTKISNRHDVGLNLKELLIIEYYSNRILATFIRLFAKINLVAFKKILCIKYVYNLSPFYSCTVGRSCIFWSCNKGIFCLCTKRFCYFILFFDFLKIEKNLF
jgi:small subunit ribosomal protein S4